MGHNSDKKNWTGKCRKYALNLVLIISVKSGWNRTSSSWGVVLRSFVENRHTDGQTDDGEVIPICQCFIIAGDIKMS